MNVIKFISNNKFVFIVLVIVFLSIFLGISCNKIVGGFVGMFGIFASWATNKKKQANVDHETSIDDLDKKLFKVKNDSKVIEKKLQLLSQEEDVINNIIKNKIVNIKKMSLSERVKMHNQILQETVR